MEKTEAVNRDGRKKKPYRRPKLVDYGPVSRLIKGGATSALSDHGANMMYP